MPLFSNVFYWLLKPLMTKNSVHPCPKQYSGPNHQAYHLSFRQTEINIHCKEPEHNSPVFVTDSIEVEE